MTFLDTNVCLDLLGKRSPWHEQADTLIEWHIKESRRMAISVISVPPLSYLLMKYHNSEDIRNVLRQLFQLVELLDVTENMTKESVSSSWNDLEDAIQYQCALFHQATCIITRNKKDYTLSEIPIFSPEEWIQEFIQ